MIDPFTAMLVLGTGLQIYSSIQEGETQAESANMTAQIREREAQETLARLEINRRAIIREGKRIKTSQLLAVGASNVSSDDDTTLSMLEQTNADMVSALYNADREAYFRANSLRTEGRLAAERGGELRSGGYLRGGGSLLTGAYSAYKGGAFNSKTAPLITSSYVDERPFSPELFNTNRLGIRYIG